MTKLLRYSLATLLFAVAMVASAQRVENTTVYLFGVGMNFADSTVYLSAVQRLDDVAVEHSQGYLLNRFAYSDQFNQYLYTSHNLRKETCCVFFSTNRNAIERRYVKLRKRLRKERGEQHVIEVGGDAFQFAAVPYSTPQIVR